MDNNVLAELQAENSQLRNRIKNLQTSLCQTQNMAQKEIDKNASIRSQLNQVCSMNEHLRAENARLIQQQVNNVSSSSATSSSAGGSGGGTALSSTNHPFVSPTSLVPQLEAANSFWQAVVGISSSGGGGAGTTNDSNYASGHQQQQAVATSSALLFNRATTLTPAGIGSSSADDDSKVGSSSRSAKLKRELRFHCDWPGCAYATAYGGDLNKHKRKHTGERPYQCDQCHATFGQHSSLSAHRYTHSDMKRFHCPQCEYSTNKSSDWTKHLKTGKHKKSL
ncbi:hypothetical protein niasHT_015167 [Heterodera trifolii]|uniref:C2H2-type domain-containing protein n=1 Tax=Heterodera trifolii TaxID=157864 RepID=A0ABD2LC26_9BILA